MIAVLWIISGACALVFGLLFRASYAIRRLRNPSECEIDRAEWLETIEGGLAIAAIGLALVAWGLLVK